MIQMSTSIDEALWESAIAMNKFFSKLHTSFVISNIFKLLLKEYKNMDIKSDWHILKLAKKKRIYCTTNYNIIVSKINLLCKNIYMYCSSSFLCSVAVVVWVSFLDWSFPCSILWCKGDLSIVHSFFVHTHILVHILWIFGHLSLFNKS